MIRFIHCMKRRPELTTAEFREYWNSAEFAGLLDRMTDLLEPVNVIKNLTFNIEFNNALMQERGAEEPYDGTMEMWLEDSSSLQKIDSEEAHALRDEMALFQEKFLDFKASKRFFTEWAPVTDLG